MNAEFPGASYDAWKTRSPDDESWRYAECDEQIDEECDCVWYKITSGGRRECPQCGRCWSPTIDEIEAENRLYRDAGKELRRERQRKAWERVRVWFRIFLPRRRDESERSSRV